MDVHNSGMFPFHDSKCNFCNFFLCSERFIVAISKSDSTQKVNQPQKIENSTCVFTVSMHSIHLKVQRVSPCTFKIHAKIVTLLILLLQLYSFISRFSFYAVVVSMQLQCI